MSIPPPTEGRSGSPARLALVVPGLPGGGGVAEVARFLADAAVRSGKYRLELVSLSTDARDPASVRIGAPGTWWRGVATATGVWEGHPFVHVGAPGGELEFRRYASRTALAEVLGECALIQVVAGSPAWANAVLDLGKPVSLHVATRARVERQRRDARPAGIAGRWRKAMTRVTDYLDDRALRRVDAIQVMNPQMLDYAKSVTAGRNVDVRLAPPGIDTQAFHPAEVRPERDAPYVLCVGRLDDPRKNVGLLLAAFVRLPPELRARARLVLAGYTGPAPEFWRRAAHLGVRDRVEFVAGPDRNALVRLYQGAAAFVLPSDEEGFGMVLLEAMACAVPVVSTRCAGPEGIVTDGRDGFLVNRDDVDALADRVGRLLRDPAHARLLGRAGRQTVEARFAADIAAAAFVDVWHRLQRTGRRQ